MFYIISSRIPLISSDNTNRKYFKLFVTGSVFYVLIHYYLNKEPRFGLLEKFKRFMYHVMAVDLAIACILSKYIRTSKPKNMDDLDNDNKSVGSSKKEQQNQAQLAHELEEQRRLFLEEHQRKLLHERMMEQKMLEQRAMEQRALEQRALEQKAAEQKAQEQKKSKKTESDSDKSTDKSSVKSEKKAKDTKKSKEQPKPKAKETTKEATEDEANTESELPIYN